MPKPRRRRHAEIPPVSLGGIAFERALPMPWVHYPGHYGTFLAFGAEEQGPWFLCQCARTPLTHLAELNRRRPARPNANPQRRAPLDSRHVPDFIADLSQLHRDDPLQPLNFRPKLCHRCNLVPPAWRYCHEMYGGRFDQAYGWYVNQMRLRLGVLDGDFLPQICPESIQRLVEASVAAAQTRDAEPTPVNQRACQTAERRLKNAVIDLTREEFGFRKVGEGWVSETMLGNLVRRLFPDTEVLRHHRPEWLGRLELDVFVPAQGLALEYQGQQHFHPVEAWGGEEALARVQERDRLKARLCRKQGVTLVAINYTDPLTEEFVGGEIARHRRKKERTP
ncbi:MAG: hypothetical protein JNG82_11130 [Opitutaceae bacterium]|nr:hypothetical protein [Opitutaceae bacterium]